MLTQLILLVGLLHLSQGNWVSNDMYPTCIGTMLPNFSYAKTSNVGQGSYPCLGVNAGFPSGSQVITWYYYDSYPAPGCGNPSLPAGDQCCHSTTTSTIAYYNNAVFIDAGLNWVGTLTGNVTAGEFYGKSVTKTITKNLATLNLNCDTGYGQEASVATVTITISDGPVCLNGAQLAEYCPGSKTLGI